MVRDGAAGDVRGGNAGVGDAGEGLGIGSCSMAVPTASGKQTRIGNKEIAIRVISIIVSAISLTACTTGEGDRAPTPGLLGSGLIGTVGSIFGTGAGEIAGHELQRRPASNSLERPPLR